MGWSLSDVVNAASGVATGGLYTTNGGGLLQGNSPSETISSIGTGQTQEQRDQAAARRREAAVAASLAQGKQEGLALANLGYGQDLTQTGQDIQRIRGLLRQRTDGTDPVSEAIRNQKAGAVANAQRRAAAGGLAGGAMEGAIQDLERKSNMDVAASLYGQQAQNIASERTLASNMLSGTTALMYGGQGLANAGTMPTAPQASGMFGTVICTELYKQGYYTNEILMHDIAYGAWIRAHKPEVYIGYRLWADPVVKLMQKSKLFTKMIAFVAVPWATNMAGEYNTFGNLVSFFGEPICGILGKISMKLGARYV